MSDGTAELSVTFKYGKGFEEPWTVFRGDQATIRKEVIAYFDMVVDDSLSLNSVVIEANRLAHGGIAAVNGLNATIIKEEKATEGGGWGQFDDDTPESQLAPQPESNPNAGLLSQLAAAPTTDALVDLWARNKPAFENEDVLAAYQARGKALAEG